MKSEMKKTTAPMKEFKVEFELRITASGNFFLSAVDEADAQAKVKLLLSGDGNDGAVDLEVTRFKGQGQKWPYLRAGIVGRKARKYLEDYDMQWDLQTDALSIDVTPGLVVEDDGEEWPAMKPDSGPQAQPDGDLH